MWLCLCVSKSSLRWFGCLSSVFPALQWPWVEDGSCQKTGFMLKRFVVSIFCTCYPTEPVLHCTGAVVITLAQSFKALLSFFRFCTSPGLSDGSVMSVCFVSCLPDCFAPLIYICQPQLTSPLCIICCTIRHYYTCSQNDVWLLHHIYCYNIAPSLCIIVSSCVLWLSPDLCWSALCSLWLWFSPSLNVALQQQSLFVKVWQEDYEELSFLKFGSSGAGVWCPPLFFVLNSS